MAGESGGRTLEQTPTWAVATVCFVLIFISIIIEHIIHLIGHWLMKRHKTALYEALEKLKSELMLLGFLSLLLTVGGEHISHICVSERVGATWLPCKKSDLVASHEDEESGRRRLLTAMSAGGGVRRVLAGAASDKCLEQGKVAFVSSEGIHQLHIFIFVLAVFHVLYCVMTLVIGRLKMRKWKSWEMETRTMEYQFSHDPERFRFARQTSFGRRHLRFWTKNSVLMWIVCFFRQFVRSVPKIDYLTLRHGFVMAHLGPQSQKKFDFQQYINRSLEEDFKVVVGISPPVWFSGLLFILFNTHGWYAYLWLPFIPLIIILVVGTKLQVIITQMGLSNQEGGEVVKGLPVVKLGDHLFWFSRPRLMLYLINFVLFQNSFQLAFLAWTWYEFGFRSCFANSEDTIIRISMGVLIQVLCSYVTLPLYALVTQMGTTMKLTIFNEKVAKALRSWHHAAKKQVRQNNKGSRSVSPMSSRPTTPSHHLLRHHRSDGADSLPSSRSRSNLEVENWVSETESPDPSHHRHPRLSGDGDGEGSLARSQRDHVGCEKDEDELSFALELSGCLEVAVRQHEMDMGASEFSFQRKPKYTNSKT